MLKRFQFQLQKATRAFVVAVALVLFAILIWAFSAGNFFQESEVVWTLPWGKQMLADLYAGFVVLTILMVIVERNWLRGLAWAAPLYLLGNIWALVWLAVKLPDILRRLRY